MKEEVSIIEQETRRSLKKDLFRVNVCLEQCKAELILPLIQAKKIIIDELKELYKVERHV